MISRLADTPLAHSAHSIAQAVSTGHAAQAIAGASPATRGQLAGASTSAFVAGLNDILLIAAVVAFAGGVLALALIRQKDFVDASGGMVEELPGAPAAAEAKLAA